ncbi:MAG TPA: hypothetical protein VKV15_09630 [Bryobacteraceae bacterium]|nr:hypothetical protein [Bryobacteraceae bacterium]
MNHRGGFVYLPNSLESVQGNQRVLPRNPSENISRLRALRESFAVSQIGSRDAIVTRGGSAPTLSALRLRGRAADGGIVAFPGVAGWGFYEGKTIYVPE